MISSSKVIKEYLSSLNEMSEMRKDAERQIRGLSKPIILHILKIIIWKDDKNFNKHISDIDEWIYDVMKIDLKPRARPVPEKDLYDWLFDKPYGSERSINILITRHLKEYHNLPKNPLTANQEKHIFNFLRSLYTQLSKDIFTSEFETIKDYLPEGL